MQGTRMLGFAAVAGLGLLAAGCTQPGPSDRTMAAPTPVRDTGSMQIPDHSMGNLRQGPASPGAFQASPDGLGAHSSMAVPDHSMGNLRRSPPTGPVGTVRAFNAGPDTGSMQIPEHSMGNLRRPGTTR